MDGLPGLPWVDEPVSSPNGLLLDRGSNEFIDEMDPPPKLDFRCLCVPRAVGEGVGEVPFRTDEDESEDEIELREAMEDEVVMDDLFVSDFLPLR